MTGVNNSADRKITGGAGRGVKYHVASGMIQIDVTKQPIATSPTGTHFG